MESSIDALRESPNIRRMHMLTVTEIYPSIQGESTLQGLPCVFVRLAGCNLSCRYCDTPYARHEGESMSVEEVIARAVGFGIGFVCITGGEPLLQSDTPELAQRLLDRGIRVSVETNGSLPVDDLPLGAVRIIDVKCPGSGGGECFHEPILRERRPSDEFKFVLTSRDDFKFARAFVRTHCLSDTNTVLLSPVRGSLEPSRLAEWMIAEMPEARLNLQLHRCIWPSETRGR
jgi:7-carboxy-7-deazaguanine synthase